MTERQLLKLLERQIDSEGSARQWAKRAGVDHSLVSLVRRGLQPIGPRMTAALGYRKVVRFEPLEGQ